MHCPLGRYTWYNTCRPHTALDGRTPDERYRRIPAACRRPRFEPRPHWPGSSPCASPQAKVRGAPGVRLQLVVDFHLGQKHLLNWSTDFSAAQIPNKPGGFSGKRPYGNL